MNKTNHPKLQAIIDRRARNNAALFVANDDRVVSASQKPRYLPADQQEQQDRVNAAYREELDTLANEAKQMAHDAQLTIQRIDNPYRWLGASDAATAGALAPFVRDDYQRAGDVPGILALVSQAATGDKVQRWLAYRYASERVEELAKDKKFNSDISPESLEMRETLAIRIAQLKSSLIVGVDRTTYEAARSRLAEAREINDQIQVMTMLRI